jgi:hypothetical protein
MPPARRPDRAPIGLSAVIPARNTVLLVTGDKAGQWTAWYRQSIPLAEARYTTYLKEKVFHA